MSSIPESSLSSSIAGSPQLIMQFARADNSIAFSLSIGSLNSAGMFANQSWAYSFSPYKVSFTGNPVTKFRLCFNGIVNGDWVSVGPVDAGTYWLTGLSLTSLSWNSSTGDKSATVSSGEFRDSLGGGVCEAEKVDALQSFVTSAGTAGETIKKLRYRVDSETGGTDTPNWSGTVVGDKVRRFTAE